MQSAEWLAKIDDELAPPPTDTHEAAPGDLRFGDAPQRPFRAKPRNEATPRHAAKHSVPSE